MTAGWCACFQVSQVAIVCQHADASRLCNAHPCSAGFKVPTRENVRVVIPKFCRRCFARVEFIAVRRNNKREFFVMLERNEDQAHDQREDANCSACGQPTSYSSNNSICEGSN